MHDDSDFQTADQFPAVEDRMIDMVWYPLV